MKKRMGVAFALLTLALLSLAPTQAAFAQAARPRDVLALQQDLTQLDNSLNRLPVRQRQRFEPRVTDVRDEVLNLKSRMDNPDTWEDRVTKQEVDDLRSRIAELQADIDRAQTQRASRSGQSGSGQLPAGSELDVRLDQTVSSRSSRVEERVEATVVEPVIRNGRTVVPAGTVAMGYVAEVQSPERGQRDARLRLEFDGLRFADGTRADIRSRVISVEERHVGRSTKETAGLGALLGGVLGGIVKGTKGALIGAVLGAGGAIVATRGQDVELPEGTHLIVRLEQPIAVARR